MELERGDLLEVREGVDERQPKARVRNQRVRV